MGIFEVALYSRQLQTASLRASSALYSRSLRPPDIGTSIPISHSDQAGGHGLSRAAPRAAPASPGIASSR